MGRQFKNNRVWHSFLKNASPIVIRFKGAPMESKHNDEDIVFFEVRGDTHDKYYYVVENGMIEELIADDVPHGEWIKCTFDGMKSDATMSFEAAGSSTNATKDFPRPDGKEYSRPAERSLSTGNIVDDYSLCVDAAKQIIMDKLGVAVMTVEAAPTVQAMAATLYINWSYTKFTKPLTAIEDTDADESELLTEVKDLLASLPNKNGKAHDGRALKTTLAKMEDALMDASAEALDKYKEWLVIETDYQQEDEPEELEDELPF